MTRNDARDAARDAAARDAIARLIRHTRGVDGAILDRNRSIDADLNAGMSPAAISARNVEIAIDLGATKEELDSGVLGLSEATVRVRRRALAERRRAARRRAAPQD